MDAAHREAAATWKPKRLPCGALRGTQALRSTTPDSSRLVRALASCRRGREPRPRRRELAHAAKEDRDGPRRRMLSMRCRLAQTPTRHQSQHARASLSRQFEVKPTRHRSQRARVSRSRHSTMTAPEEWAVLQSAARAELSWASRSRLAANPHWSELPRKRTPPHSSRPAHLPRVTRQ